MTDRQPARPANSPNSIVSAALGGLAFVLALGSGPSVLVTLLAVAALVTAVVGLARNEPARLAAAVGLIVAVFTFL